MEYTYILSNSHLHCSVNACRLSFSIFLTPVRFNSSKMNKVVIFILIWGIMGCSMLALASNCKDKDNCYGCVRKTSWNGGKCRWCPLDSKCHAAGECLSFLKYCANHYYYYLEGKTVALGAITINGPSPNSPQQVL